MIPWSQIGTVGASAVALIVVLVSTHLSPAQTAEAQSVTATIVQILGALGVIASAAVGAWKVSTPADKRKLAALAEHVETLPKNTPGRGRLAQLLGMIACLALCVGIAGCKGFLTAAPLVGADVGPVLTCVMASVEAATVPATIEDAVAACVQAGVDIDQTVVAIEALVATPDGSTNPNPVAERVRRMPHRAVKR
jgi:hypothetical protein